MFKTFGKVASRGCLLAAALVAGGPAAVVTARADILGLDNGANYTLNTLNNNGTGGPTVSGGTATLTDNGFDEARSLYYNTPRTSQGASKPRSPTERPGVGASAWRTESPSTSKTRGSTPSGPPARAWVMGASRPAPRWSSTSTLPTALLGPPTTRMEPSATCRPPRSILLSVA